MKRGKQKKKMQQVLESTKKNKKSMTNNMIDRSETCLLFVRLISFCRFLHQCTSIGTDKRSLGLHNVKIHDLIKI